MFCRCAGDPCLRLKNGSGQDDATLSLMNLDNALDRAVWAADDANRE